MAEKASLAEGRIISATINITMTPPQNVQLGETDAASAMGSVLIMEAMQSLQNAAEKAGFTVKASITQIVY